MEGIMKFFSKIISTLTLWMYQKEWEALQASLNCVYTSYLRKGNDRPSVLAQQLLISGEDHRFFSHGGVDLIAVLRAAWRTVVRKRLEGASTIEMQIVRVVTGRFERTLQRKAKEMCMATLVTRVIPKSELPSVYLHIAYYGWRMNSFNAASTHLKLRSDNITPIETAKLVARLKYPQPRTPSATRQQQIAIRANHLLALQKQHKVGYIYNGIPSKANYAAI